MQDALIWLSHALDSTSVTVYTALMHLRMPFDDHTGTECRTEPETLHCIDTPDISSDRNIDSLCGRRSMPNDDVVPRANPQRTSRKTDLIVHSALYPEAYATYESYTSRFAFVVNTQK